MDGEPTEHQPLYDRAGDPRAGDAKPRRAEVPKDQDPVQRDIGRDAAHDHEHHGARAR